MALAYSGTLDGHTPVVDAQGGVRIFRDYGKHIFGKSKSKIDVFGIQSSKYDERGLESILNFLFKDAYLSDTLINTIITSVWQTNNEMVLF